jgi:hypothetical protein
MNKFYPKETEKPNLHIVHLEEKENGELDIKYEINDKFRDLIKKEKKTNELSDEIISEYIKELLENCAQNKNGYSYSKVDLTKNIDK